MVLERFLLTDRVAVVTGAGRGIGAASAVALAEAGADVVVSSRTATQLDDVAARIEAAGRQALVVPADLCDLDNVARLATAAHERFGHLDVVINNVGGTIPNAFSIRPPTTWRMPSTSTSRQHMHCVAPRCHSCSRPEAERSSTSPRSWGA